MNIDYHHEIQTTPQTQKISVAVLVRAKQKLFKLSLFFITLFFATSAYYHYFHKAEWIFTIGQNIHNNTLFIKFLLLPISVIINLFTFKNEVMAIYTIAFLFTSFVFFLYSFRRNATERQEARGTLLFSSIAYIYVVFLALFVATGWIINPDYLEEIARGIFIFFFIITVAPIAIRMLVIIALVDNV